MLERAKNYVAGRNLQKSPKIKNRIIAVGTHGLTGNQEVKDKATKRIFRLAEISEPKFGIRNTERIGRLARKGFGRKSK